MKSDAISKKYFSAEHAEIAENIKNFLFRLSLRCTIMFPVRSDRQFFWPAVGLTPETLFSMNPFAVLPAPERPYRQKSWAFFTACAI